MTDRLILEGIEPEQADQAFRELADAGHIHAINPENGIVSFPLPKKHLVV
jgi:hypothetical protein